MPRPLEGGNFYFAQSGNFHFAVTGTAFSLCLRMRYGNLRAVMNVAAAKAIHPLIVSILLAGVLLGCTSVLNGALRRAPMAGMEIDADIQAMRCCAFQPGTAGHISFSNPATIPDNAIRFFQNGLAAFAFLATWLFWQGFRVNERQREVQFRHSLAQREDRRAGNAFERTLRRSNNQRKLYEPALL